MPANRLRRRSRNYIGIARYSFQAIDLVNSDKLLLCVLEKQNEDQRKNEHFFEEEALQVVDESKRPKDIKIINDVFGLDGTFKKLEID